jgi:hypothetical protein
LQDVSSAHQDWASGRTQELKNTHGGHGGTDGVAGGVFSQLQQPTAPLAAARLRDRYKFLLKVT